MNIDIKTLLAAYSKAEKGEWGSSDICSYQIVYDDKKIDSHINDICFARMGANPLDKVNLVIVYPHTLVKKNDENKGVVVEDYERDMWLDYILKESPFKNIFLTKEPSVALSHGVFIDPANPANVIVGGATLLRYLAEFPLIVKDWYHLVSEGVDKDVALLAASVLAKEETKWIVRDRGSNHTLFSNISIEIFENYLKGTFVRKDKSFVTGSRYTLGSIQNMFGNRGDPKFVYKLKTDTKVKVDSWGDVRVYPAFSSTEVLKKALDVYQGKVEPAKPKVKIKPNKKDPWLVSQIRMDKGFTLAEVRRIRKELRDIFSRKTYPIGGLNGEGVLESSFVWVDTLQGYHYWKDISNRLDEAGYDEKRKLVD